MPVTFTVPLNVYVPVGVAVPVIGMYTPDSDGRSSATSERNVGAAAAPLVGPARTVFAVRTSLIDTNAPEPPIAMTLVAEPPAPPVPVP